MVANGPIAVPYRACDIRGPGALFSHPKPWDHAMDLSPEALLQSFQALPGWAIYGLLGLSAFVENIVPPIPGDTITALGAFLVGIGRLDFTGVFLATTVGSLAGFLTLFAIGAALGRRFFFEKDYRFFRARDIVRAEEWFRSYGYIIVALNRFFPGVRSAVSVASGISGLRPSAVALLALLSCSVWNGIWIFLGYSLGSRWEEVEAQLSTLMRQYNLAVAVAGGVFILALILIRIRRRRR